MLYESGGRRIYFFHNRHIIATGGSFFIIPRKNGVWTLRHRKRTQGVFKPFYCSIWYGASPFTLIFMLWCLYWKIWVNVCSAVLLKDILPPQNYRCWLLFVRSCSILLSYFVREPDLVTADLLLLQFCREFHMLHGNDCCTFNMHLHLHLKQTILDFGPAHASWCFAFERFNGILGSFHINKRSIEPQIMRKFSQSQAVHDLNLPSVGELQSILPEIYKNYIVENSNSFKVVIICYQQTKHS